MATKRDYMNLREQMDALATTFKSIQDNHSGELFKMETSSENTRLDEYIGSIQSKIADTSVYLDAILKSVENESEETPIKLQGSLYAVGDNIRLNLNAIFEAPGIIKDTIDSYFLLRNVNQSFLNDEESKNLNDNYDNIEKCVNKINPDWVPKKENAANLNDSLVDIPDNDNTIKKSVSSDDTIEKKDTPVSSDDTIKEKDTPVSRAKVAINAKFDEDSEDRIKDFSGVHKLLDSVKSHKWNSGVYNDLIKNTKRLAELTKDNDNLEDPVVKEYYTKVMDGIKAYKKISQEKLSAFSNADTRAIKGYAVSKVEEFLQVNYKDLQDSYEKTKSAEEQAKAKTNETPGATLS